MGAGHCLRFRRPLDWRALLHDMTSLDYYAIEQLLTDQERAARDRARRFVQEEVLSEIVPCHRAGKFPEHLTPRMGALGFYAPYLEEHGCDPGGMETHARREGKHYILNGSKCWIGNASIADVKVVWARGDDGRVGGFVVERDAPGFRAQDIEGKFSLRMSRTSECWFENCRIPAENRLPKASGLGAALSCLSHARTGIAWGVIGAAIDCFETALAYAKSREQFGRPIAGFQLAQQKLVWMAQEITKAQLLALRLTRLMEMGAARPAQISLAKRNNVWIALQCARKARDILGAAGITDRYSVIRHLMNLETVYTYEGTHDIHALIVGRDITGVSAFGG